MRSASIEGTPLGLPLGTAIQRTEAILKESLPAGYRYEWSGEGKDLADTGRDILFVLILAILVVYMVLAAQFESLIHPFTVMLALPLAIFGALGLLWFLALINHWGTGLYAASHFMPNASAWTRALSAIVPRIPAMNLNLFSQIGLLLLVGVVTKNSILLVEFSNQRLATGAHASAATL